MNLLIPFTKGWRAPLDLAASLGMSGLSLKGEQGQQIEHFETGLIKLRDEVSERIDKAEEQTATADAECPDAGAEIVDPSLALSTFPQQLAPLEKRRKDAELAEDMHRLRMGITRPAKVADFTMTFLVIGIFAMVESVGTASFFLNANMVAGPVSALLLALLISFTNVMVSTCAGYFIGPYLDYGATAQDGDSPRSVAIRQSAWFKFILFLIAIVGLHLTTGLIRSQEELAHVAHGWNEYADLLTTPEAVFLMLMGICMSAIAFHKGRNLDDPIPGYGERHRAVLAAQEAIQELHEETAEGIAKPFDEAIDDLKDQAKALKRATNAQHKAVNAALSAERRLEQAISSAESKANAELVGINDLHHAATLKAGHPKDLIPNEPVSFAHFLEGLDVPDFFDPPDIGARINALKTRKAEMLTRLSGLLEKPEAAPVSNPLTTQPCLGGLQ
ncbi:MAG: hypothetical protein ACPG4N_04815 [Gammaproteobacteria bacterium]